MWGWRCMFCGYYGQPFYGSRVSSTGTLVIVLCLLCCFPFFWLGFLIKESLTQCPHCRHVYR